MRNHFPGTKIFKIYIITIKIPHITIIRSMLRTLEYEIRDKKPCDKVMAEFARLKLKFLSRNNCNTGCLMRGG